MSINTFLISNAFARIDLQGFSANAFIYFMPIVSWKYQKNIGLLNFSREIDPAGNHMFKVNNKNTRTRREKCSKLTIKTPEQWPRSGVFIISRLVLVFLLLRSLIWEGFIMHDETISYLRDFKSAFPMFF